MLVDGQPTPSCQMLAGDAQGKQVVTIEGLARDGQLHPLQQAFIDLDVMHCGYCTPGMILAGVALLTANDGPQPRTDRRGAGGARLPLRDLSGHHRRGATGGPEIREGQVSDERLEGDPGRTWSCPICSTARG